MALAFLWGWDMMANENTAFLEHKTMTLEVVTPVCIADSNKLNTREYLYDKNHGKVYLLQPVEWFKYLYRKRVLDQYERYLMDPRGQDIPPYEWLKNTLGPQAVAPHQWGKAVKACIDVYARHSFDRSQPSGGRQNGRGRKKNINDILPAIRLVDGTVYIPGSSIKGMMRTAILIHLIRRQEWAGRRRFYWHQIQKNLAALKKANQTKNRSEVKACTRKWNYIIKDVERELLCILNMDKKNDAINDALRGLRCGDAILVKSPQEEANAVHTAIVQKIDIREDSEVNYVPLFLESIIPGTRFRFSLTLEKKMMSQIGISSADQLLGIVEEAYRFLNHVLQPVFSNRKLFSSLGESNAYLGRNNGFLHKTVVLALAEKPKDAVPVVREILCAQFRDHKAGLDKEIAPHMLKGTEYEGIVQLMGGVKISSVH